MPEVSDDDPRAAAIGRIKTKRDFRNHVAIYALVNAGLVVIWALSGGGYFWPVWSIIGWGIGVAVHGYTVFIGERPISEDEINEEMGRGG